MRFINSCKKTKFSFFLFLVLLILVTTATAGTVISAKNLNDTLQSANLIEFIANNDHFNLFKDDAVFYKEGQTNSVYDTAATFTVSNLNDSGAGSLRKAVADAKAAAGDDLIVFDNVLTGTIILTSGEILIDSNISISKTGTSSIAVSGNNASRVFNVTSGVIVSLTNISVINGKIEGSGGGILNAGTLNLSNVVVSDNTATYSGATFGNDGGGIFNTGVLNVQTSTIKNNKAVVLTTGSASGGGLSNTGTATVNNSSIILNSSIGKPSAYGGGIFNGGNLTVTSSTIGNNSTSATGANSKSQGGAIFNSGQGTLTIRNTTVGFNKADAAAPDGGGIYNVTGGMVMIRNTIVSDSALVSGTSSMIRDVFGTVTSEGNNLISNATGSTGWVASDKLNQPALLTPLGNYGGPTQTFGILQTSPAIDMGSNAGAPATDQRGATRIVGGTIDIGSFENNPNGVVATLPNGAIGTAYNQQLATSQSPTLTFALIGGALPPGLSLSASGAITGTPTAGGLYTFDVSITDANGNVSFRRYTIFIPSFVTNLNDSGIGSLRKAIEDANSNPGDDNINFQPGLTGILALNQQLSITSNITIVGTGVNNLMISGNNVTRVFNIAANSNVSISNLTIRGGKSEGSGAGILNAGSLNLANVVITDSVANYTGAADATVTGGGISNSGTLTMTTSTVKNNTVTVASLGTASGGGIFNSGTFNLINSTVNSNSASGKPTAYGGGISNNGTFNISNSTVGINTASAGAAASGTPTAQGGGIRNGASGVLTVRNTTVGFNSVNAASAEGGGIYNVTGGMVMIRNTIVSDSALVSGTSSMIRDVFGTVTSEGNNLISNATGSTGWVASDKLNQPALLTPLGNYGGPTQTFGILQTSPAFNGGNNANPPATDQRGATRIVGGTIDIGSFENNPTGVITLIPNGAVGTAYSQSLPLAENSPLTFSLVAGALPPGLSVSSNGTISGTPTTGGTFNFSLAITGENGLVNFQNYVIVIGCTFSLATTSQSFTSAGGSGTINVITQNGCFFNVVSNNSAFITVTSGPTGSGAGTVNFTVAPNNGPARTGSLTIAGIEFTVTQASGCTFTLSPTSSTFTAGGGLGSFNVTTPNQQCSFTGVSNASWITVTNGSGTGNGSVSFSVAANNGAARTGTITVEGRTYTVNQETGCTYVLTPPSSSFAAAGGTGSFTVSTTAICTWTAVSNVPWLTINSGNSGAGNGTVTFTVAANTNTSRTGTITVGDKTFTVNQEGGCVYTLSAMNANFPDTGGTGSVNVTAGTGCTWTAVSNVPWITITGGASGTSNGTVNFTVAANNGAPRTGTLTIAGKTFTVTQSGCDYVLSSNGTTFSAAGGSGSFGVTSSSGCGYTAVSNVSWITIVAGSGTGSGTITFTVQANVGPQRTGTITVNGQVYTITQTGGCSYSIFPTSTNIPGTASTGSFNLNVGGGCEWTVVSNVSWITITSPTSGNGGTLITFSAQANPGAARTGTITVGGQTFTVNQAAAGAAAARAKFDFDGDGKSDISVFRPGGGVWYLQQSTNGFAATQFGDTNDKIVPADYDGDGKTDLAVYRSGTWYLQRSTAGFIGVAFGAANDIPQPADFDGDGKSELVVWRPSNGIWYVYNLVNGSFTQAQFGATIDKPIVGDYDGDGKADFAVFRPTTGVWFLQRSTAGFIGIQFGDTNDKPVPADYDGDGKTDLAVFRPSNGTWYLSRIDTGIHGITVRRVNRSTDTGGL